MQPHRALIVLFLLLLCALCIWGVFRLLGGQTATASAKHELGAVACGLGALFFGAWAVNLLTA